MVRRTCVVDGDTFWLEGVKIRIADIDTPEISEPRCDAEYALGIRARDRLRDLLNEGPFALEPVGTRDEDQYGRKLRVVIREGNSLGDRLVAEGPARTWTGRREPWC
ncbi:thermonuclease family protein [Altererythrobacter buctensis]|uniref:Thermonuclease family protein n=2 Tax=Alteraurantiacibacter buctensis TaxID=1503981 RepID=A0A844YXP1_9SPHN|nr:thermonuclease family protein [Alteraurantiacibacter buctensis]